MITKFAGVRGNRPSEFFDLNHKDKRMTSMSRLIQKFARDASSEVKRTSSQGR
jgi:hypothetical protein